MRAVLPGFDDLHAADARAIFATAQTKTGAWGDGPLHRWITAYADRLDTMNPGHGFSIVWKRALATSTDPYESFLAFITAALPRMENR